MDDLRFTDKTWEEANDFLSKIDPHDAIRTQEDLVAYLEIGRLLSWDIPSTLPFTPYGDLHGEWKEIPMHRPADYATTDSLFYTWEELDHHYRTVHNLDLADPKINWSFDT